MEPLIMSLARQAFQAYTAAKGGTTHDGKPIPPFDECGEEVQQAWCAAAAALRPDAPTVGDVMIGAINATARTRDRAVVVPESLIRQAADAAVEAADAGGNRAWMTLARRLRTALEVNAVDQDGDAGKESEPGAELEAAYWRFDSLRAGRGRGPYLNCAPMVERDAFKAAAAGYAHAWRRRAEALWGLLDDIDTLSDSTSRHADGLVAFQRRALELVRRRTQYLESRDGQTLEPATAEQAPPVRAPDEPRNPVDYTAMTDAEIADTCGASGDRWALAFVQHAAFKPLTHDLALGWFCNAIEAARSVDAARAAGAVVRSRGEHVDLVADADHVPEPPPAPGLDYWRGYDAGVEESAIRVLHALARTGVDRTFTVRVGGDRVGSVAVRRDPVEG